MIEPGESHDAQMIFEIDARDEYTLHYGSGSIEDAKWQFTEEDIKREIKIRYTYRSYRVPN